MTDEVNILQFPKHKIIRERLPDIEEINKLKEKGLQKFADFISSEISDNMLEHLSSYGIDIETDAFIKDFYFATMILNAAIYRSVDLDHPMHEYINNNIQMTEKNDST